VSGLIREFSAAIRGLRIGKEQRHLAGQAVITGVVVWTVIFALKEPVHWIEHAPAPLVLFIPLAIGALTVAVVAQFRSEVIKYRDGEGDIERLDAVEGAGIERAIALDDSADASVNKGVVTGAGGLEARWQMPTFALAFRKFIASLATLGSGGSGGSDCSSVPIGENLAAGLVKLHTRLSQNKIENLPGSMRRSWEAPNPDFFTNRPGTEMVEADLARHPDCCGSRDCYLHCFWPGGKRGFCHRRPAPGISDACLSRGRTI